MPTLPKLPRWIANQRQRSIVAFICTGAATVIAAAWAVFLYANRGEQTIEATYHVCTGDVKPSDCPPGGIFLGCPGDIAKWTAHECAKYTVEQKSVRAGGGCGFSVVEIKCTAKR
jgi:hypothetical protein